MLQSNDSEIKGVGVVTSGKNILEDTIREVSNIDDDSEPEATVQMSKSENIAIEIPNGSVPLSQSDKPGFDPNSVANALRDSDNEGGIARNRTAMNQNNEGMVFQPKASRFDGLKDDTYEVTGFTIQFQPKGEKGIVSIEISDRYFSLDEAMKHFKQDQYIMPDMNVGVITTGAPVICKDERQVREYIDEKWRRC